MLLIDSFRPNIDQIQGQVGSNLIKNIKFDPIRHSNLTFEWIRPSLPSTLPLKRCEFI